MLVVETKRCDKNKEKNVSITMAGCLKIPVILYVESWAVFIRERRANLCKYLHCLHNRLEISIFVHFPCMHSAWKNNTPCISDQPAYDFVQYIIWQSKMCNLHEIA